MQTIERLLDKLAEEPDMPTIFVIRATNGWAATVREYTERGVQASITDDPAESLRLALEDYFERRKPVVDDWSHLI